METTKININVRIRIKLTKEGARAFNLCNLKERDEFLRVYPNGDCSFIKTNYIEGDIVEGTLWYIFSCLGDYFKGNTNAPFVKNEIEFLNKNI